MVRALRRGFGLGLPARLLPARLLPALALLAVGLLQACAPSSPQVQPTFRAPVAAPVAQPSAQRPRIGLMLPLSGRQAALGRTLAASAQAAFIERGEGGMELIQADSEGTPDGAARAASALLAQGVAIVVGPLFAAEVRGAAPVLRGAGVPVLALSSDRAVAEPGVFVTGLLPEDQVRAGLGFVRAAGAARIAVLGPDDASGRAFAEAARALASEMQVEVTRVALYPAAGDPAGALAQLMRPEAPARGAPAPPPGPPFDTLLLAESGPRLRLVAALLPSAGLEAGSVRLLGPAPWVAEPLVQSEPALAGALMAAPDEAAWEALATRLGLAFGNRPPRVGLVAHDAMAVAVAALRGGGTGPVPAAALSAPEGFAAATGRIRLLPDGRSQRAMRVYQATGTGLRNLGPAPFEAPLVRLDPPPPRG